MSWFSSNWTTSNWFGSNWFGGEGGTGAFVVIGSTASVSATTYPASVYVVFNISIPVTTSRVTVRTLQPQFPLEIVLTGPIIVDGRIKSFSTRLRNPKVAITERALIYRIATKTWTKRLK